MPTTDRSLAPSSPFLLAQVAAADKAYQATRVPYVVENVLGAKGYADPACSTELRGLHVGVQSAAKHLFVTPLGYKLLMDHSLVKEGSALGCRGLAGLLGRRLVVMLVSSSLRGAARVPCWLRRVIGKGARFAPPLSPTRAKLSLRNPASFVFQKPAVGIQR